MDTLLNEFQKLNKAFKDNGFKLYLVGGTVRDYLMRIPLSDMDAVTDATPEEMKRFLPTADYTFERFGSVKYRIDKKVKFDITTLREEKRYIDSRHPAEIRFVKELEIDVKRRDFTLNALYLDGDLNVIDLVNGQEDLSKRVLRMIGDPVVRLKEDPLRIVRAFRFYADYDLSIDEELSNGIKACSNELGNLNIDKIKEDLKKAKPESKKRILQLFEDYNIKLNKDVVE